MNNPLVSVFCVTYNHIEFIRKSLTSVLEQECDFDFEILIHDDASTDGTQEVIKEFQEKYPDIVRPILQTKNQWSEKAGSINLRFNLPRARGKFYAFCEGDDFWIGKDKLQNQVDFLRKHPEYNVICGGYKMIERDGSRDVIHRRGPAVNANDEGFEFVLEDLSNDFFIRPATSIARVPENLKSLLEKHEYSSDLHSSYYLLKNSKGFYHQKILAGYNRHEKGVYSSKSFQEIILTHLEIFREFYEKEPTEYIRKEFFRICLTYINLKISFIIRKKHTENIEYDPSHFTALSVFKTAKKLAKTKEEKRRLYKSLFPIQIRKVVKKIVS